MSQTVIEDIYPLTPLQELMLVDAQCRKTHGTDILSFELDGPISADQLEAAWIAVHERHPVMRSMFHWKKVPQPMQVVRKDASPWVKQFKEDAPSSDLLDEQNWTLNMAPQLRLAIVGRGESKLRVVIGYRPSMFDGWSVALIVKEFLTLAEDAALGRSTPLPQSHPFREYVAWLQQQSVEEADSFWKEQLFGIDRTTPIRLTAAPTDVRESSQTTTMRLSDDDITALKSVARQLATTPNSMLQALWAILLSCYCDEKDVMFGTATSGRPAEVMNVDSMVGSFFNNVVIRLTVDENVLVRDVIKQAQTTVQNTNKYCYTSPMHVRDLWAAPANQPLFQSIFLFHNFPLKGTLFEQDRCFSIDLVDKPISTAFPITLVCVPELSFELRLIAKEQTADRELRQKYLDDLKKLVLKVADDPSISVEDLKKQIHPPNTLLFSPDVVIPKDLSSDLNFVPPASETQKKLARIFEDVLIVKNIGIHNNFFELGARSMQMVKAVGKMTTHGIPGMTPVDLFEFPTIAMLAEKIEGSSAEGAPALKRSEDKLADAKSARRRRAERRGNKS